MGRKASYVHFTPGDAGKPVQPALVAHLRGDENARPVEAVKRLGLPRAIDYGSEPERAQAAITRALTERAAAKTGGRPPSEIISVLFAAPPTWDGPDAWPMEKVDRWMQASNKWLRKLLPREAVTHTSTLHTDEAAPHGHTSFVPACIDGKGVYSLSWKRVVAHMAEQAAGGPVRNSARVRMTAIQDSYYRDVAQHFGMERGKRGRGIEYAPLDRAKGAARRIEETAARLEEERKSRAEAERQRAEAETARQRTETQLVAERRRAAQAGRRKDQAYSDAIELADTAEATAKTATARLEKERTARTEAERQRADAETARQRAETQLVAERRRTARANDREDAAYDDAAASLARADALERKLKTESGRADQAERRAADAERNAAVSQPRGNPHRGAATTARADRRTRRPVAPSASPTTAARETPRPAPEAPRKPQTASRPTPAPAPGRQNR